MEFHILDAGPKKYGDCILCRKGNELILIDGGHPGDQEPREDDEGRERAALQDQMAKILGEEPPFELKLLVVTHAHLDHIGCLPKLVTDGIITAKWALVADEKYGWGNHVQDDGLTDGSDLPPNAHALLAALREDAVPDLSDEAEVEAFLADAESLEDTYGRMLKKLKDDGTKIVRYGRNSTTALLNAFSGWKMKILGPTKKHLILCADEVRRTLSDAAEMIRQDLATNNLADTEGPALTNLYRKLLRSEALSDGKKSRPGHALNDQSIVLSFGSKGERVLLAGDMQFVLPGFGGIDNEMRGLWKKVKDHGKYLLAKTCHHTSRNAFNKRWMEDMGWEAYLVHSGGEENDDHPNTQPLDELKSRAQSVPKKWLRNDRNGLISCTVKDGEVTVKKQRGKADDFSPNFKKDELEPAELVAAEVPVAEVRPVREGGREAGPPTDQMVEVNLRIPHRGTRVTMTIEVTPEAEPRPGPPDPHEPLVRQAPGLKWDSAKLGGGRSFPRLLAVTDRDRLAANVGAQSADRAIAMLRGAGLDVMVSLPNVDGGSAGARGAVRQELEQAEARQEGYLGVLLVGGHDVVPHVVVDALPPNLRNLMKTTPPGHKDQDDYIVWSDHLYGDVDGKGANELPVSRVPDAHSADLLLTALSAPARPASDAAAFGLRNINRPFADTIFRGLNGGKCLTSAKVGPRNVQPNAMNAHRIYLMLHGSAADATVFNGEEEVDDTTQIPALDLRSLPKKCAGAIVFTGCCWGALTLDRLAAHAGTSGAASMRHGDNSIALAFLRGGARAYIGCTGTHYSPEDQPTYFGGPMHAAFWQAMRDPRMSPALALHEARIAYLNGIPHGRTQLSEQAIEHKIFHQFACLGIGW